MCMVHFRRVAPLLSVLLLVAGCGSIGPSPDLKEADLVGAWASKSGGTITLNADGTFSADRLRACVEGKFRETSVGPDAGSGTWTLLEPERLNPYQDVKLDFGPGGGEWPHWKADEESLRYTIGDPDAVDFCVFRRS